MDSEEIEAWEATRKKSWLYNKHGYRAFNCLTFGWFVLWRDYVVGR